MGQGDQFADGKRQLDESMLIAHSRILENMAEGVNVADPEGFIFFTNRAFDVMFGYAPGELRGKHVSILNAADGAKNQKLISDVILGLRTAGSWSGEFQNRRKNGTLFVTRAHISVVEIEGADFWVSVQQDVSQEKNLQEQIRHSQKMDALGRLAGGVAHDFNNLLSAILGFADLLKAELDPTDARRERVEGIVAAADRAALLTRQLLLFSRKAEPSQYVHDLHRLLHDMGTILRRILGEENELDVDSAQRGVFVSIEAGLFEQIVLNLVLNARDASPSGGRIELRLASVEAPDPAWPFPAVNPGPYAALVVSDSGTGMSPEVAERVFEPFYTTKAVGKGTGLGMSTVLGIVEQCRGHIKIDSTEHVGTRVMVLLPRVDRDGSTPPTPIPVMESGGSETILLVEDDEMVSKVVTDILRTNGYAVIHARDGLEALQKLTEISGHVPLVISDMAMPRMTGLELGARMAKTSPQTRLILMSGYSGEQTDDRIAALGAAFIAKPFSAEHLLKVIRKTLGPSS